LKVKSTSSSKDIKLAYYKLAKKHHPDFQPANATDSQRTEAEEFFKDIVKAYETLSNPIAR
jgi:DnaJ-class molecular chaperone